MNIELSEKEFRRLLDMIYIGNWILNSTRGDDRFEDYDLLQEKLFALCPSHGMRALVESWQGHIFPSRAYEEGGIHEAIADYEDAVFYNILAEELARYEVVIATEVGGGVVPVDREERAAREAAGRLACLLARRADAVVRVFCGIPVVLKGKLP